MGSSTSSADLVGKGAVHDGVFFPPAAGRAGAGACEGPASRPGGVPAQSEPRYRAPAKRGVNNVLGVRVDRRLRCGHHGHESPLCFGETAM